MQPGDILVADNTGKELVFSATCYEDCYTLPDGTQTWLEISKVDQDPMPMSETGDKIIAAAPVLLVIAGVGSLIQVGLKIFWKKPDEVKARLKELERKLNELEEQMNAHFADMKSFITEKEFTVEILSRTSVLMKLMRDCLEHHNTDAVENFRIAYEQNPPIDLAYTVISFLEQKPTNPLLVAMEKETGKTKKTFEKWEQTISEVLAQFVVIKAFASGLLKGKNLYISERIIDRSLVICEAMKMWRVEYMKDKGYWSEASEFLKKFMAESKLSNEEKARKIMQKMDTYLTNDHFFVLVFRACYRDSGYSFHCPNEKDQIIAAWSQLECHAIIYRSQKAHSIFELPDMQIPDGNLELSGSIKDVVKKFVDQNSEWKDGFVCLVNKKHTVAVEPQLARPGKAMSVQWKGQNEEHLLILAHP